MWRIAKDRRVEAVTAMLNAVADAPPCRIGLVGEYNAGKSTLINALLGARLLPAMEKPTTKSITEVEADSTLHTPKYFKLDNGAPQEIGAAEFGEVATGRHPGTLLLRSPANAALPTGLRLVDTPGLASTSQADADFTFGYLPELDGIILCHDVMRGELQRSELEFLARPEVGSVRAGMLVVLTCADRSSKSEVEATHRAVVGQVAALGLESERVVALSAEQVLCADPPALALLDELRRQFDERFVRNRDLMQQARRNRRACEAGTVLLIALRQEREALSYDDSAYQTRLAEVEGEIVRLKRARTDEQRRLEEWKVGLEQALDTTAKPFASAFASASDEVQIGAAGQRLAEALATVVQTHSNIHVEGFRPDVGGHHVESLVATLKTVLSAVDAGVFIVTAAAVAAVSGGATLAANAAEAAVGAGVKAGADIAIATGVLGGIGRIIKAVNPVEYAGKAVRHLISSHEAGTALPRIARSVADAAVAQVQGEAQRRFFGPILRDLETQQGALRQAGPERTAAIGRVTEQQSALDAEIAQVQGALADAGA